MIKNNHTISVLVNNKPGVLLRIATIFSRRTFNIDSLVVSPALDGVYSRMTITAIGNLETLEQIIKQLNKLIDVIHASEHQQENSIEREIALIKVHTSTQQRTEALQLVNHFKGETIDVSNKTLLIQITGSTDKLDAAIKLFEKFNILEIIRSGKLLMSRGEAHT